MASSDPEQRRRKEAASAKRREDSEVRRKVIKGLLAQKDFEKKLCCTRDLHNGLKRLLHRWREVVATDVGFLVRETEEEFVPKLGIRIHVREKIDRKDLEEQGKSNLAWPGLLTVLVKRYSFFLEKKGNCPKAALARSSKGKVGECCELPQRIRYDRIAGWGCDLEHLGVAKDHPECYRLYIEHESGSSAPCGCEDRAPCEVPIDVISVRYFPSNLGVQVGPSLPNSEGFRNEGSRRLGRHRVEPVVGGVSLGNSRGSAGTLGAVVWDTKDGRPCILSNWHVLGGTPGTQAGQPCYQPALFDGGNRDTDRIGLLKRWIFNARGDAGLADLDGSRYYAAAEILGLWHPVFEAVVPKLGMEVRKWGRESNYTEGFIDGVDLALNVEYREVGLRYFEGQLHIAPLVAGEEVSSTGDSGAVWVTRRYVEVDEVVPLGQSDAPATAALAARKPASMNDMAERVDLTPAEGAEAVRGASSSERLRVYFAVGLHFAGDVPGSPFGEHAVATPITDLMDILGFSFRPVFPHPDHCVLPQGRLSDLNGFGGSARRPGAASESEAGPVSQIDTGFRRDTSGPQPDPDPLTGHP